MKRGMKMLANKRKKLIKSIVIEVIILILLISANVYVASGIALKVQEKAIYNVIVERYPNLIFDKQLAVIAEECAEKCFREDITADDIKILENENFIRLYSSDSYIAKYTLLSDSDKEFTADFLTAMQNGKYPDTDSCLKKCRYIGIGKYRHQFFLLAFYNI